ncbi:hypothetical protein, partial [Klebsiella quasipneumoniae]|uniref:hypothetical protein n=1 Tax=Klebsiella quasipneumoniae TaxID=1463165 RepID=UPI001D12160A
GAALAGPVVRASHAARTGAAPAGWNNVGRVSRVGQCRPGKATAATRHNGWSRVDNYPDSRESRVRATG